MGQDAFQAADLLGSVVDDRFEILEKLGEGGMGAIYKARQISMNREVALKILLHDQRGDPISVERFRHEAYLASRLNHPNAIVIHDFGQSADGLLYIAMEFLEGQTLKERIRRVGRLPLKSALAVASQTLRVLAEAHRMGLVHRDIKPDNIFLTQMEGDPDFVKVLDFGIAKLTAVREGIDGYQGGLTIKGKIYGTPNYMSPEQIRGKPLDHQSDLYSFGIVLYELLAGHLPFEAETPVDVMMMHLRDPPPSLVSQRPEVKAELENVVLRALEKDRRLRFQNADEFLEAIESYKFSSGFYAVPARLMVRSSTEEPADDDDDVTGALGATLLPGTALDLPMSIPRDEDDDDDVTLMGAQAVAPPADERTMMEFEEKTAFEQEAEASADMVGDSVFELMEDSLLSPPAAAAAQPLTTGLVSVVRPGPGPKAAPTPLGLPTPLGPPPPRAQPGRALGPTPAPRPAQAALGPPAAQAPARPAPAPAPAPVPARRLETSVLDADDLEEVEPSRLVPIPHFDDSLGGDGRPGRALSEPLPASPFGNRASVQARAPAAPAEAPRAPAVAQRAAAPAPAPAQPRSVQMPAVARSKSQEAPRVAPSGAVPAARVQDNATVGTDPRKRVARSSRKGLIIGITAAVVVFGAALVVLLVIKPFGRPGVAAPVGPPKLNFASDPEGLEIFRNGRFIGETPVIQEVSQPGEAHDLQVATRTRTFQIKVPALPESTWLFIRVPGEAGAKQLGHTVATSKPPGAVVRLGDKEIGRTPLILIGPADEAVELDMEHGGQHKKATTRTAAAGERVEVVLE